jgi:biopolymer transport protein TolQ
MVDTPPQMHGDLLTMMLGSGPVVQAVLFILIGLSLWSWTITIAKYLQLKKAKQDSKEFSGIFWDTRNFVRIDDSSRRLIASPLSHVFASGFRELNQVVSESEKAKTEVDPERDLGTVERALKRASFEQSQKLEQGITFLATVASAAPFIGLFGTVWGIMNAFHGLGMAKSTSIQAVAPGISEALVATAIGLAAAIPAAIAYNYFVVATKEFREHMETFSGDFLNIARRYVLKG